MNFREFVGAAEVHLRMTGWLMHGHNGVWRKYKKAGDSEAKPFPAALCAALDEDNAFHPDVEHYLSSNGWRRSSGGVIAGWPLFHKDGKHKKLIVALLEQLRDDRTDRAVTAPRTTPSEMKRLLVPSSSPPPSVYADTARARVHR